MSRWTRETALAAVRESLERAPTGSRKPPEGDKLNRANARYAKALDAHERIEADLARAMNRWQKSRALLKRLGKRLDAGVYDDAPADADPFKDEV